MKKNYFNVKVYTTQEVVYLIKIDITYFHDISPPFLEKRKKGIIRNGTLRGKAMQSNKN